MADSPLYSSSTVAPAPASIITIALTGGPSSGKTTSLAHLRAALERRASVYIVPETPTIVMGMGFPYPGTENRAMLVEFELSLLEIQLKMEEVAKRLARARALATGSSRTVLILDRAVFDMRAYMPPSVWDEILQRAGRTESDLLSSYDAVLHLVTASDGAREFYAGSSNNATRTETADEAIALDRKTLDAWSSHPSVTVFPNLEDGFDGKLKRVVDFVLQCAQLDSDAT